MKRALILICLMCMALTCAGCAGTSKVADRELLQVSEEKPLEPEEIGEMTSFETVYSIIKEKLSDK